MVKFEEAQEIIKNKCSHNNTTRYIGYRDSLHFVLAEDLRSDVNMPPFNKSAMDGYACRKADLNNELEVIEIIPAGKTPEEMVNKNQCSKIMTGAMVPKGADCVIMVEHTKVTAKNKIRFTAGSTKDNYVPKGEDVQINDTVLKKGTFIRPQHIAVMATTGCTKIKVFEKIKIGVISTGDELVEPENKPGLSQIRNSNAYQLEAQIKETPAEPFYFGIAKDDIEHTRQTINQALEACDIVLLTGGVSMGDFDFIPKIMTELDIQIHFKSIAVQPGRPTVFGTKGEKYIFGLPGNPVSSFNIFELFVKPLIYYISGVDYKTNFSRLPLGKDYTRKRSSRLSFLPVKILNNEAVPIEYHGSAHINALTLADGLIAVPIGITRLKKGEIVDVRPI